MATTHAHSRVVTVLGMHRGGTSASMRSLMALGVEVGSDLLPPGPAENPRGFFEDAPLLAVSERVLEVLGLRWDSTRLIPDEAFAHPGLDALELEAARSIRTRFAGIPVWGFKNPRTARLLPFWRRVFARVDRRDAYLIVLRNPISVARSLAARNAMGARRASLLWLLHMTDAVIHTRGAVRVCLDYDALLDAPEQQLDRLARGLALTPPKADPGAVRALIDDFLSDDLRSTRFEAPDLPLDESISALAVRAYELLRRSALDDDAPSQAGLQRSFGQIRARLRELEPLLVETDDLEERRLALEGEVARQGDRIHALQLARRDDEQAIADRTSSLAERERELTAAAQRIDALVGDARARADHERTRAETWQAKTVEARSEAAAARAELGLERGRSGVLRAELQAERDRAEALGDELAAEQDRSAVLRAELEIARHQAGLHLDALARARAEAASIRAEVQRANAELGEMRALVRRTRDEAETAEQQRAELEARRATAEARAEGALAQATTLRRELEQRSVELERRDAAEAAQGEAVVDWLHAHAGHLARQLVDATAAFGETRTWKTVASLQRLAARLRGRPFIDGHAQLARLTGELYRQAGRNENDARHLAVLTDEVRRTLIALTSGEIFRLARAGARAAWAIRGRSRTDGPLELLRHRSSELLFHLQHLEHAPFETAGPPPPALLEPARIARTVDVVVPVYESREVTLRCLRAVLEGRNVTPFELIVVDDGSRDRRLHRALDELAREGRITLLRNASNLGFPATANRGMAQHPDRDVVLLNSDTLVHGDWLDRLRAHAVSDWKVATVTPLSNNAEICSYPALCRSDALPEADELADLDAVASRANAGRAVRLPTGVGFCLYVRRTALRDVGDFDAERFARGYGEENDFCLRARDRGYQHVLAADVFVGHEGGTSFAASRQALIERAMQTLDRLHPGYHAEIQAFIEADPVRSVRRRLDAERLGVSAPSVLLVSHAQGGGTERHVRELAGHLEDGSTPVLLLQPEPPGRVRLSRPGRPPAENLVFDPSSELDALVDTLRQLRVRHVHLHHTLGMDDAIRRVPELLGVDYDVTLHDYISVCPRVHLVDDRETFCGLPESDDCEACVKRSGSVAGFEVDVAAWRAAHIDLLTRARRVIVPSEDVMRRLDAHLPDLRWLVRRHPERYQPGAVRAARPARLGRRRVAVLGAIGPHKGSAVLVACAADAAQRNLPLEFRVVGFTDRDEELRATGRVHVSGPYEDTDLPRLIARARCHLAFFPAVWPETHCYTLSAAFENRLYPVAFDLGAVADRIRGLGWGGLLPMETSAAAVNDYLLAVDPPSFPASCAAERLDVVYDDFLRDYYDGLSL